MASVVGASPNHVNNYFDVPNYPSYAAHPIAYAKRHAAEERAGMTPIEQMHDAGEIEGFHLQAVNRLMADIKRAATRFGQGRARYQHVRGRDAGRQNRRDGLTVARAATETHRT